MSKTNQKEFRIEKVIKKKGDKLYVKWKRYNNSFNSWIDKKRHSINEWVFSGKKSLGANVKVELDLSNYATKADLKNAAGVDRSDFAKKTNLANSKSDVGKSDIHKSKNAPNGLSNLKSKIDKLDFRELETTPVDLSKLSDVIKNGVVKKTEYNELVRKFNNINTTDTSNLVKKTNFNTNIH